MKKLTTTLFLAFIIAFSFQSCKQAEAQVEIAETAEKPIGTIAKELVPGFVHAVYFWIKKDDPELVNEFLNEGLPRLAKIESIQSVSWGPPAGTDRTVVDNSYDMAWIVNFANSEDHDAYQIDPLHVEFVEKYKSIFEKIQVFDNDVDYYASIQGTEK